MRIKSDFVQVALTIIDMMNYKQFFYGIVVGAWIVFFSVRAMILQEFSKAVALGDVAALQLRNEALDDFLLFPLFVLLPVTVVVVITFVVGEKISKRKTH